MKPRIFTYEVFVKYHGPWNIRLQMLYPVPLLVVYRTIAMCFEPASRSRTLTSWMCPELPCTGGDSACRQGHIKPVFKEYHWLPIWARISFKIATSVHKVRINHHPLYLADLINDYRSAKTLHSSSMTLLKEPPMKSWTRCRCFSLHFCQDME